MPPFTATVNTCVEVSPQTEVSVDVPACTTPPNELEMTAPLRPTAQRVFVTPEPHSARQPVPSPLTFDSAQLVPFQIPTLALIPSVWTLVEVRPQRPNRLS